MADLQHWCDRYEINWATELDRGTRHYQEETEPEENDDAKKDEKPGEKPAEKPAESRDAGAPAPQPAAAGDGAAEIAAKGLEPRFVSEANFLRFRFERGRYFLVGREQLDGRPVLKVEYYPKKLFAD